MVRDGSFLEAIRDITQEGQMGYVMIDETDRTPQTEEEDTAHNAIVTEAQDVFLYKAAKHRCPIWIVTFLDGMDMMVMRSLKNKPSDRVEGVFQRAGLKIPAANATFVLKNAAYPFGNSIPPLEDGLKRCPLRDFVYMGFHTNACVRAAAVGPRHMEDTRPGAAGLFGHTIWTCREILRGQQGNANWKDHEKVNFYNSID
jgi:hypothetical protein